MHIYIISFYLPSSLFYLFIFGIFELGTYKSLWLLAKELLSDVHVVGEETNILVRITHPITIMSHVK